MKAQVQNGQVMMDMAVQYLGDVERLFEIAVLNDVGITDVPEPGTECTLPEAERNKRRITRLFLNAAPATNDSGVGVSIGGVGIPDVPELVFAEEGVPVRTFQSMLDITVQELGDIERLFEIAVLNNTKITERMKPGTLLRVPEPVPEVRTIIGLFDGPHKPATADRKLEGIDYWYLEDDFVVQ